LTKTVLLVEDSKNDVELALEALAQEDFIENIIVVEDGQQALEFLLRAGLHAEREPGNPILIVLDLKLPRIDGLEVLRRVKSDPRLKNIPIVMLTSSREDADLKASYNLGANAYVVKPVGFEEYTRALQALGSFWTTINEPPPDSTTSS
jgi:CheY-like chemotaxis protein